MEKLYSISYKLRYAETSDWETEYIRAKDREHALKNFARLKQIKIKQFRSFDEWRWEEGVWSAEFRSICEVKEMPCPHCSGTGIIHS